MAKVDNGISVKLDKDVYEIAKVNADKLGLSVAQYLSALVRIDASKS